MQCIIHCGKNAKAGFQISNPNGSKTYVNGIPVKKGAKVDLKPHDRIIFGSSNIYRIQIPGSLLKSKLGRPEHVTWTHAIEELNQGQMAAFSEQHRAEREEAERMRKEMEMKLREMEQMINQERQKGGT